MPVGEFLAWHPHDREAAHALRNHEAESCGGCGVHPRTWKPELGGNRNAVVPSWEFCRVCDLIAQAKDAGPPTKSGGWNLVLKHTHANAVTDREEAPDG